MNYWVVGIASLVVIMIILLIVGLLSDVRGMKEEKH